MPKTFESLLAGLRENIRGEVSFDDGRRALYATDASNYRQIPIGVVVPKDTEDVVKTIQLCREAGAPVLMRGAGTSLAGQGCNAAVVIDTTRYLNQILEIDPQKKIARVQPGVVLDDLRREAGKYGLTFGPDPATHNRCTIGGMIGNNACGVHSVTSGKTADNLEALEILTYDGLRIRVGKTSPAELEEIIRKKDASSEIYSKLNKLKDRYSALIRKKFPKLPRRVSGYNLYELLPENGFHVARALTGTEGTCVTVLEATLKLIPNPKARVLVVLGYEDVYKAGDDVAAILKSGPIGLEGLDEFFVSNMKKSRLHLPEIALLPEGSGWLLVEFGGESAKEAEEKARGLAEDFKRRKAGTSARLFLKPADQKLIWSVRESSFGATVFVPGEKDTYAGFEDSAVPPAKLGDYMRDLRKLYDKYGYYAVTYGHFGDGCLHTRISFDLRTEAGIARYREFQEEAAELVIRYGGSLSGEHGDGQTWGHLLPKMFGPELVEAFREFKSIWDPQNKMNPGKVVDAFRSDENLRLKKYDTIPQPALNFKFAQDNGDFARTTERCIGIGKCLKKEEGVMCPSFRATHDEMHSPRGRAHLLHEMMRGESIKGGWKDEHVKEALDLCLACKACKTECPVSVDVATYKAEFLSHYYQANSRPFAAYLFGFIAKWAGLGSRMPQIANFFMNSKIFGPVLKKIAGIAQERNLPAFAGETFREWFQKREVRNLDKAPVLLWTDTFSNYFYPEIAKAAVEVLEKTGHRVALPPAGLCCGRPLYDFGMLADAKCYLEKIMQALEKEIVSGMPVIGLEPSCLAVFRDELVNLFPENETAKKLSRQSFLFAEFLEKKADAFSLKLNRKITVHGHCHQKALVGMGHERNLLEKLGAEFNILDSGCCGMAGAFGFEKDHYKISMEIGRKEVMSKIPAGGLMIADGFSCREQIVKLTGKRPLHLAEWLRDQL